MHPTQARFDVTCESVFPADEFWECVFTQPRPKGDLPGFCRNFFVCFLVGSTRLVGDVEAGLAQAREKAIPMLGKLPGIGLCGELGREVRLEL